jgi:hypothetical protein
LSVEQYFTALLASDLPFAHWIAVLAWAALFFANHRIVRITRAANDAQHFIAVEDWSALRRGLEPKYMLARILFAAIVFAVALFLDGPAFAVLAGGLIVAMAYALALNVQGLWSARALAHADAATGVLTFSTASAFRHMAQRVAGGALACFIMGVVLAQLALIGGALFLALTARSYLRRARKAAQPPAGEVGSG